MSIYTENQHAIAQRIDSEAAQNKWQDWRWQQTHVVKSLESFEYYTGIQFSKEERQLLEKTIEKFPLSITPYYLSLIDLDDYKNDPIFKQSFPSPDELILNSCDMNDPLSEEKDSPAPGITFRYPDRVLFHISNVCAMYCRHCTRKRKVGDLESIPSKIELKKGIDYIKNNPQIRDVLLSGGDPLLLADSYLDWILGEIKEIKHVEIIRIGTRVPIVLPYRITNSLVSILKKYNPLWINTHFNHPRELTASSKQALAKLANAGFPLGNQTVLLAGVNDCPRIIKRLGHVLVQNRVRPYYMYQCDLSEGLSHFRTPIGKGIEIIENLIGHTSGLSIPTYVVDAPGGGGKIPIMPNYIISWSTNKVILRNYEGVITTYEEPTSYEPIFCDRKCKSCSLQLKLDEGKEMSVVGVQKLLADFDATISLIPSDNDRISRREETRE